MSDIQYWNDSLTDEVSAIRTFIEKIPGLDGAERVTALARVEQMLKSAHGTKRGLKMETRLVKDPEQQLKYVSRLVELESHLQRMTVEAKELRAAEARGQLLVGDRNLERFANDDVEVGDQLLSQASQIQGNIQDSLSNTKNMIAAAIDLGKATLQELEQQSNTLNRIDREAELINGNLAKTESLLKQLGKHRLIHWFVR